MRNARRTFFNRLYQPDRIGKAIFREGKRFVRIRPFKQSEMVGFRRFNRSKRNQVYGRYNLFRIRLAYPKLKKLRSFMVQRCSVI